MSFNINKNLARIYFYLVALVTLIICIFQIFSLVNATADYLFPTYDMYAKLNYSAEEVRNRMVVEQYGVKDETETKKLAQQITVAEVEAYRAKIEKQDRENQKRQMQKRLFTSGISLIFVVPIYLYHYRLARKTDAVDLE
ncbi:MAG: hypothetical protein ACM3O9_02205 [Methylocystaceae bacterium]